MTLCVSMLTRLIQRTESVSEGSLEEYEYRDAEYEYEEMPEHSDAHQALNPLV